MYFVRIDSLCLDLCQLHVVNKELPITAPISLVNMRFGNGYLKIGLFLYIPVINIKICSDDSDLKIDSDILLSYKTDSESKISVIIFERIKIRI